MKAFTPILVIGLLLAGCTTAQASFTPIAKGQPLAPRAADYPIEVFEGEQAPVRPYDEVATLDVHLEATHFITFSFADALPRLKEQARAAGADAIMAIRETRSRLLETSIYHLTAKAIRYRN